MSADISKFLALVTTEHNQKPRFIATIEALIQPVADAAQVIQTFPKLYDLDFAVGEQLDVVGLWVGVSRYLTTELQSVFFSWDTQNLGWNQGRWRGPFDPTTGLTRLEDDHYRVLLRAKIIANHWDGTIPGAYAAWDTLFGQQGITILLQDGTPAHIADFTWDGSDPYVGWNYGAWADLRNLDKYLVTGGMTALMALIAPYQAPPPTLPKFSWDTGGFGWNETYWDVTPNPVLGPNLDAVTMALFRGGYLALKPAGVQMGYVTQSYRGKPIFAWDVGPDGLADLQCPPTFLAGWDNAAWGVIVEG